MGKRFADRLAELERLEAQQSGMVDMSPLTDADCDLLGGQVWMGNVRLTINNLVERRWPTTHSTAEIDAALARFNGLLVSGTDPKQWSDCVLELYCAMLHKLWPALRTMSDAELEALCNEEF